MYNSTLSANNPGQRYYELSIYHSALYNFTKAPAHTKTVRLTIKYFDTADTTKPKTTGVYEYAMIGVSSEDGIYTARAKFDKKVSGSDNFQKTFPKNLVLKIDTFGSVKIMGKGNTTIVTIPYSSALIDEDMDCFLTSACVNHRQLEDDCLELNTLRSLRDGFMTASEEGRRIIREYETMGPRIVRAINDCENQSEIYEYMYQHLVLPSVAMVQSGEKQEAVDYYQQFVKDLRAKYLL